MSDESVYCLRGVEALWENGVYDLGPKCEHEVNLGSCRVFFVSQIICGTIRPVLGTVPP